MKYQEFLQDNIDLYERTISRMKDEKPYPRSYITTLKGIISGLRIALMIATHNNVNGELDDGKLKNG